MILFHEGMPRSGKSYEAVVKHIIPALQAGRPVQAYIEGLNFEKIAACAGLPLERVQELLTQIQRSDVSNVGTWSKNNSLVVIDEVQSFWPNSRKTLDEPTTYFVTEHGHRGIDVLLMGQVFKDVHKLWRGRTSQKIWFMKRDMVGAENSYKWTLYKATQPEQFEKINTGVTKYDSAFFGTYASHVSDDIQTANYKDTRATIWKSKAFGKWLPLYALLVLAACGFLYWLFAGGGLVESLSDKPAQAPTPAPVLNQSAVVVRQSPAPAPVAVQPASSPTASAAPDYIADISKRWRPRLSAWMSKADGSLYVLVEWYDASLRKMESLRGQELAEYGYTYRLRGELLELVKRDAPPDARLLVTAWPLDPFGSVTAQQRRAIGEGGTVAQGATVTPSAPSDGPSVAMIGR